jgi:hypothetical protein
MPVSSARPDAYTIKGRSMSTEQAVQAQALYENHLLAKSNVVGVAVGFKGEKGETSGDVAVVVLVEEKKPLAALSAEDVIPKELEGMKTDVYEVGYLRALQVQTPRDRYRPIIPNGISVGHYKVTAGTLGTMVRDRGTLERLILSNNHVLANANEALVGDSILQPAAMDGGHVPDDVIATLERFVTLRYIDDPVDVPPSPGTTPQPTRTSGCDMVQVVAGVANMLSAAVGSDKKLTVASRAAQSAAISQQAQISAIAAPVVPENRVDCALARPVDPNMFSDDTLTIGIINDVGIPLLGMRVAKYGRTTGYTEGNITLMNATINVAYNTSKGPRTARFVGQVMTEGLSQGGDSGSLVVDVATRKAVGLLFGGSNLASIFTPIDLVLSTLNITL